MPENPNDKYIDDTMTNEESKDVFSKEQMASDSEDFINDEVSQEESEEYLSGEITSDEEYLQYRDEECEESDICDDEELYYTNTSDYDEDPEETQNYYDDVSEKSIGILGRIIRAVNNYVIYLKNTEPKKRLRIISGILLCVFLFVLVVTDFIPVLPNAYNRFYVGNSYVIGETQGGVYDKIGKDVIYAGKGSIMTFGHNMECKLKKETSTGNPCLETDGKNAIVYYRNSNEVYLLNDGESIKDVKSKYTVTGASVNKKGYYTVISDESGYKSCVEVFDPAGKSIYKWHTNNTVIDAAASHNGSSMVASSYTATESLMSGKLIFFDMGKDHPVNEIITNSNIISEVRFIGNDVSVAFGDLYTASYTSNGTLKWRIDYSGRILKSYDIAPNGDMAFIFDRYNSEMSESTVEIYNSSGRLIGKYESRDNVKYVSANNDRFLLSLDRKTVLLNDNGDVLKKKNSRKDFRKAVLYHNYNFAFTVTESIAEIMSVNH